MNGKNRKKQLNVIMGITARDTVMVDCDNVDFRKLVNFSRWVCRKFKLEGFIILKSSSKNYHVVFNRQVSFMQAMRIAAYYAICLNNANIGRWVCMQLIKRSATLRVTAKGRKKPPKIVFRYGETGGKVAEFLEFRRAILKNAIRIA